MSIRNVIISLDLGYGNLKAVSGNRRFCFRTIYGIQSYDSIANIANMPKGDANKEVWERTNNMAVEVIETKVENGQEIELGKKYYFVGDKALRDSKESLSTGFDSDSRYSSEAMQHLIRVAIDLFLEPNYEYNITLCLGLPIAQFTKEREEVKATILENLEKYKVKWFSDGHAINELAYEKGSLKRPTYKISEVLVLAQSIFSAQAVLYNSMRKFRENFEEGDIIALLDIGFKTVDGCLIRITKNNGFEIVPNNYIKSEKGVKDLYLKVRELIKKETEIDPSDEAVQKFIDNKGKVRLRMRDYDFSQQYQKNKEEIVIGIVDDVKKVYEKQKNEIGIIYLIGGGSVVLEDEVKKQLTEFNRVELFNPDNKTDGTSATYANALGFYRTAKLKAMRNKIEIYEG